MKKSPLNWPLLITATSLFMIAAVLGLRLLNKPATDDNKNKLTLIDTAKKLPVIKKLIEKNALPAPGPESKEPMVLESERHYTEKEIADMTETQFIDLLALTEKRLPKLSEIRKLPAAALHRTPKEILEAGQELGLIKEILNVHESFERSALPFYKNCAKNSDGPTPLRALCLTNLIEIKKKNGQDLNMSEYPANIVELAKMVTEI